MAILAGVTPPRKQTSLQRNGQSGKKFISQFFEENVPPIKLHYQRWARRTDTWQIEAERFTTTLLTVSVLIAMKSFTNDLIW